jgi:hypothetical protein
MGTPYPFKGYLQMLYQSWGYTRYNGGISRDGQWYQGEFRPFPSLAPGYVIVSVLSWGTRLIREVDRGGAYDGPLTQVSEYEG